MNWREEEDHEMKTKDKKRFKLSAKNWIGEKKITNSREEENQFESNHISGWSWNQLGRKSVKKWKKKKNEEMHKQWESKEVLWE